MAKYYIYRNLHTGGFSVKHHGRVVYRGNNFGAINVVFKVNESGRQRVIHENRKNVHAYVVAEEYSEFYHTKLDHNAVITYNPYIANYFVCNKEVINKANKVAFIEGKCYLIE